MNILVFSWRDHKHPQAGGAEQVMKEHMGGWIAGGHKVTLFSSRFVGSKNHEISDKIEIFHKGDQYIGVKVYAFIFWLINHKKFDFVVDQFHGIPFFTPLYVTKPKLAVLQELAKEVWFLSGFSFPLNYIIGIMGYIIEPFIFLLYKRIQFMVGSDSAMTDLRSVGISKNNITIVPHGVIVEKLRHVPSKEKIKTIVFLGALTKDKGIEDALRAFSYLAKSGNYNFWIIGKGGKEYEKYLFNLAEELGIKSRVIFWGFVSNAKKFELLAKAHILVNPSIREGWGLVNIEANVMGTPVVTYRSAGLVDSVKNWKSGVFCEGNTPKNLAETADKLLSSKTMYTRLSLGAKKWSEVFNWEKSCKLSLRLIEKVKDDKKVLFSLFDRDNN